MEYLTEVQDKYRGEQNKEKAQLNELLAKGELLPQVHCDAQSRN